MASAVLCDPCKEEDKSSSALKYCSECAEQLCKECADSHLRFKAFKDHHLLDFTLANTTLLPSSGMYCDTHPDFQLDLFCSQHDGLCCCACVPVTHKNCQDILPIKVASKDVKTSTLLSDSIQMIYDLVKTTSTLLQNRGENRKLLAQTKQSIIREIQDVKVKMLNKINKMEENSIADLNSLYEKHEKHMSKEEEALSGLASALKERKEQLIYLKEHGSDKQLFITLRQTIRENHQMETKIQDATSDIKEINIRFEETDTFVMESFGSIVVETQPCKVEYNRTQPKTAQVQQTQDRYLTDFKLEQTVVLRSKIKYAIQEIAVTTDNKLLFCNYNSDHSNVYVYKDGITYEKEIELTTPPFAIAVLPSSDRAVVTLPRENSIQFIDTKYCTTGDKINANNKCYGVATSTDKIFLGGCGFVLILRDDGSHISKITTTKNPGYYSDTIMDLCYNTKSNQLLLRCPGNLRCITLEGTEVYRYEMQGNTGVDVDQQGNVYSSCVDRNEIHRLTPDGQFRDVVLNKDAGLDRPGKITLHDNFTKLFVVNNRRTGISIYSCK